MVLYKYIVRIYIYVLSQNIINLKIKSCKISLLVYYGNVYGNPSLLQ